MRNIARVLQRIRPDRWGISARSAFVAAAVVFIALTLSGSGLAALVYRSVLSGIDSNAAQRVAEIGAALESGGIGRLDPDLLATDQRIVAVQIVSPYGVVIRRSQSAPRKPLIPVDNIGEGMHIGVREFPSPFGQVRFSSGTYEGPSGRYMVLVGEGSQVVLSTVQAVAVALAVSAPIVIGVSAAATYLLVRRSMRSVDAIRSQVAEISTSDLTERVPVPDTHDEIAALAVTMNEMLARIEAGHTAQQRFVGDASHELRSPLATIISALDVAAAHPELLDRELATGTLIPEAHRMQALIEDLLLLARADERGLTSGRDDVDLDDVAASEVERLRGRSDLAIDTELTPTRMVGDPAALSRVVRNLLDNAERHAASLVEVSVRPMGRIAVVTVGDDGPGIPYADRSRVFDRFVRLDPGRSRSAGGSGLGLAIVAEVVAAHGGSVSIGGRPSGGTRVTVQLPQGYSPDSSR